MINLDDIIILARTIYGEARGSNRLGKRAVAHVILNRWRDPTRRRDHTLAATCLRFRQFSAWNRGDPNREKMQAATVDDRVFRWCLIVALEAIDGVDFTKGAQWYHTHGITPAWSRNRQPCYTNDDHIFFNDVDK